MVPRTSHQIAADGFMGRVAQAGRFLRQNLTAASETIFFEESARANLAVRTQRRNTWLVQ